MYGYPHLHEWRLNDTWDPCAHQDSSPLRYGYSYGGDPYRPTPDYETWHCQNSIDYDWERKVAFISAEQFLDDFLPVTPIPAAHLKRLQDAGHLSRLKEDNRHCKFITALNATLRLAKSSDVVKDIEPNPEPKKVYHRYPELALYSKQKMARDTYTLPPDTDLSHIPKNRRAHRALGSWAHMLMPIEFGQDFRFGDFNARARMYHYAARVLNRQHRQHVFSLHLSSSWALIVRWDRSGVVVSKHIYLEDSSHLLYDFIHRLGRLTREQQGFDTTAQLAPKLDVARLLRYTTTNEHLKRYHQNMLSNLGEWPLYKVHCEPVFHDQPANKRALRYRPKAFLIGKPLNCREREEESPLSKPVRAYIAYDLAEDRLVFMKDFWRLDEDDEYAEANIYWRMQSFKIPYVATAIAGGDVSVDGAGVKLQKTVCGDYKKNSRFYHHRVVLKEVCRPLSTYTCTPELIIAVYHAILAHRDCWKKAGVLHQDISHNNIMIDVTSDEPRGVLIDFDNCILREDIDPKGRNGSIIGTTAFHSLRSLEFDNRGVKSVADDNESFIYVLVWMALRYQLHSLSTLWIPSAERTAEDQAAVNKENGPLATHVSNFFSSTWTNASSAKMKKTFIKLGRPPVRLLPSADGTPTPFAVLLRKLYLKLQEHTMAVEYKKQLDQEAKDRRFCAQRKAEQEQYKAEKERKERMRKTRSMVQAEEEQWRKGRHLRELTARRLARRPEPPKPPEPTLEEKLQRIENNARWTAGQVAKTAARYARMKKCKPVMDDHDAILEAFRSIIFDDKGRVKLKRLEVSDKYADQWLDLPSNWGDWWMPPTEQVEKRKVPEEGSSEGPSRPLKRRRV